MRLLFIIFITFTFIIGCSVFRFYSEDQHQIKGKIYVTGNEPFTELAIQDENGEVFLISKNSPVYKELWKNQGSTVILEIERRETKGNEKGKLIAKSFKILSPK
ncbi:hypothetical protein JGI7_00996 [Candidatus Kryptonium thompsonii]|jgi:hypothetical protein|uniref:Lipoprotein n=1 Tax=Candidatus Kryptonium thompsonii TaxID=1633631 RepID=A0A0P1M7B7_9BACT|nr:hypothetical protein [Candidatus Kryptonium thompsoni]CUS78578.1 hypothetical protein JGI6_00548 [Candidatus Kryptonium thompsoni]CUS79934.1 hypothetical protein JGI8_00356 [Candidatus Kryptonium thompsoni]CUS81605.1 hypothetical protein JGI13_00697 [Candidatus Kryptonium thompsoni]CUS86379.1 hypothetical protein JGI7_00996 [Candidatus Kryptonium thompsoni]CUS89622.1 hypothetical protein JGI16_11553 [Candidatus Kryptonium thompsoni]